MTFRISFDSLLVDSDNYGVVVFHVLLWIAFAIIRIPLYRNVTDHFESGTNKKIEEYRDMPMFDIVFNSVYSSMLVQSAWGLLDLIPISRTAKMVSFIQTVISFFITAGTINLIINKKRAGQNSLWNIGTILVVILAAVAVTYRTPAVRSKQLSKEERK